MTNDVIVNTATVTPLMPMECKGPEIPRTSHKPPSRGRATLTVAACEAALATLCLCVTWQSSTHPHHFRPAPAHTDTRHHQQGFSLPTSILYIAIALSHENEYHFLKILLKVPHYVKPGNCLPYYLFKQFFLFADSCESILLKL